MKKKGFVFIVMVTIILGCLTDPDEVIPFCDTRESHLFHGVTVDTFQVGISQYGHVIEGVEIRVDIIPAGQVYVDTTDTLGRYAINVQCSLIPVYREYMISAKHCDGRMQVIGGIPVGMCGPIYRRFNF